MKKNLGRLLDRFQPEVVISTFPPYPYLVQQILGTGRRCKNVAVVTEDERLTSVEAERRLGIRERDYRKRKTKLDAAAAAIILQDYLDRSR